MAKLRRQEAADAFAACAGSEDLRRALVTFGEICDHEMCMPAWVRLAAAGALQPTHDIVSVECRTHLVFSARWVEVARMSAYRAGDRQWLDKDGVVWHATNSVGLPYGGAPSLTLVAIRAGQPFETVPAPRVPGASPHLPRAPRDGVRVLDGGDLREYPGVIASALRVE